MFITLTYDDEHLPKNGTLNKKHFQDFMKRYRKAIAPKKIRFYHCGEYGDKKRRPHYHALIFGDYFSDAKFSHTKNGQDLYISNLLQKHWQNQGLCYIGQLTFESAAYVARYILKKINGEKAKQHYENINQVTGEITDLVPEYTTMSRRPGIGFEWYEQFKDEVYPDDFIIVRGKKMKPPKYYQQFFEIEEAEQFKQFKKELRLKNRKGKKDQTPARLSIREKCVIAQTKLNKREL